MKKKALTLVAAAMVLTAACINQNNRHIFYLDPDGAVTWTVVQEEIRSDAEDKLERIQEEREFLKAVDRGEHDVARAFGRLGALWVDAQLVRAERPYTVVTEARFESVARAMEEFLTRVGLEAAAHLETDGDLMRLTFCYREVEDEAEGSEDDEVVENLIGDHEAYRFVLTEGKFIDAQGFRLEAGDTAAVLVEVDENNDGAAIHSLTWSRHSPEVVPARQHQLSRD
jgi:hypothetical protein